ncbi:MAG: hypothetical protein JO359_06640 [Candidatus Eremiobacteraeota bacterium]|nr:hypothetical protein [Candidatus Eremiobacteraeota bacterium]
MRSRTKRTAAAFSAAGMLAVAGCSGGSTGGGTYHPPAGPPKLTIPANSPRVKLAFKFPQRAIPQPPVKKKSSKKVTVRATRSTSRNVKYLSPAVVAGGFVAIKIYQNGQPAFPDQVLTVGMTAGSQIQCFSGYGSFCYNTVPVFAPLGDDEFFVAMYDSQAKLLSITPGIPGASAFPGSLPYPTTVTAQGANVNVQTAGVVNSIFTGSTTPCVGFNSGFAGSFIQFLDADNYAISGQFANPVTFNVSGGWGLYDYGSLQPSPVTVYGGYINELDFEASQDGASGAISASSTTSITMNNSQLFAADKLAFTPNAGTLLVTGLVSGGTPASFNCGNTALMDAKVGTPISIANPVAMGNSDDSSFPAPFVSVVDGAPGGTLVDIVDVSLFDAGVVNATGQFYNAMPAYQVAIPGTPVDSIVSPASANNEIFVLNADGTIVAIDTSGFCSTCVIPNVNATLNSTVTSPTSIGWINNGVDELFVTSGNSPTFEEIDNPIFGPVFVSTNVTGLSFGGGNLMPTAVLNGAYGDPSTNNVFLRAFDPTVMPHNILVECATPSDGCGGLSALPIGAFTGGPQSIGNSTTGGQVLVGSGTSVLSFIETPLTAGGTFLSGVNANRILTTADQSFTAVGNGVFGFFPAGSSTSVGNAFGSLIAINTFQGGE